MSAISQREGAMKKSTAFRSSWQWMAVMAVIAALWRQMPALSHAVASASAAAGSSPSSLKPYEDLRVFRPHYQSEHQDETSVRLHAIGTSLVMAMAIQNPELLAAGVLAAQGGSLAFVFFRHYDHGLAEALVALTVFFGTTRFLRGSLLAALAVLVCGYGFAWTGHFFFEGNRPATFVYPTFSLVCDFLLWVETLTGVSVSL